jgi:hypothetical protein
MLHVTSGDATADPLRRAGLLGEVTTVIDPLHEGPAPGGLAPGAWRQMRARFIADAGWDRFETALARFTAEDAALERAPAHDETVLWFEHDLHCQLNLVRLLAGFAAQPPRAAQISLVCIGAYPGMPDFAGLGQLAPEQLAGLFPSRQSVSDRMLEIGTAAWRAFTSPDPVAIESLLAGDTSALPFLGRALQRHLEQFPSVGAGLSRSERQTLQASAPATIEARRLFGAVAAMEETPFMGDTIFWTHATRMAAGSRPLLVLSPTGAGLRDASVTLTAHGRAALDGALDWARAGAYDRWLGGVHLTGPDPAWRWDRAQGRLVRTAAPSG